MSNEEKLRSKWIQYISKISESNELLGKQTYGDYIYMSRVGFEEIECASKLLSHNVYLVEEQAEKYFENVMPCMIVEGSEAVYGWTACAYTENKNESLIEILKLWDDLYNDFVEKYKKDIREDEEIVTIKHLYSLDNPVYKNLNLPGPREPEIYERKWGIDIDITRKSHRLVGLISILPKEFT
jgi:hypothetical protein